jgi:hypothetical protein
MYNQLKMENKKALKKVDGGPNYLLRGLHLILLDVLEWPGSGGGSQKHNSKATVQHGDRNRTE